MPAINPRINWGTQTVTEIAGESATTALAKTGADDEPKTLAFLLLTFFGLLFYSFHNIAAIQPLFHVGFSARWPILALMPICLTVAIGTAFVFAQFSFGYLAGFYLFVMMAGYFWLNAFSVLNYDHNQALAASAISITFFLLPALLLRGGTLSPKLPQKFLDRAPEVVLVISGIVLLWSALSGFQLADFRDVEQYRSTLAFARGRAIEYAIGNVNGALIPFAIACAIFKGRKWMAAALCIVSLLYYPVTLTKTALFSAPFIIFMAAISSRFEARVSAILSLMIPLLIGLGTIAGITWEAMDNSRFLIYGVLNFRMLSIPSISLEHYFEFFQHHPHTYFCQVSFLKPLMSCPYSDQLGVVLGNEYRIGNMNASLFATEGLASVGPFWMPVAALACGFVLAIGNMASAGLPARFILISGAIIPHTLLNVPLSTTLLSNGLGLLMLLWWMTPRQHLHLPPYLARRARRKEELIEAVDVE